MEEERLEETESQDEDSNAAKHSRAAFLGHLVRLYNDVEPLMMNRANKDKVLDIRSKILQQFQRLEDSHAKCLTVCDILDIETLRFSMERDTSGKNEMLLRIDEWLHNKPTDDVAPSEIGSVPSRSSVVSKSSSTKLKEARMKRRVAELKQRQLLARQQMEAEEQRLKQKCALKIAEDELEQAELEATLWEEEVNAELQDTDMPLNPNAPIWKSEPVTQSAAYTDVKPKPRLRLHAAATHDRQYHGASVGSEQYLYDRRRHTPGFHIQTQVQPDIMLQIVNNLTALAESFTLPKPELLTFTGDAKDYYKFITNFETNLSSRVSDHRLKLSYLIQYCSGEAKSVIENCVLLEPREGYERAFNLLKQHYGRPHVIARSFIDSLVNGPQVRSNDVQGLVNLSQIMLQCELTLSKLGYMSDINSTETLKGVVKRLPSHIQAKWVEQAASIIDRNVEPNFCDICKFVQKRAKVASSVYGQEFANVSKAKVQTQIKAKNSMTSGYKVTTLATQSSSNVFTPRKCKACDEDHYLDQCQRFKEMSVEERSDFVRKNKLCYNCLKYGHNAKDCKRQPLCRQCKFRHHTLVHRDAPPNRDQQEMDTENVNHSAVQSQGVCLQIVPVRVKGQNTGYVETYALLDPGSTTTLCDEKLLKRLNMKGEPRTYSITTVNGPTVRNGAEVNITVSSLDGNRSLAISRVRSVDSLGISLDYLPTEENTKQWSHLNGLTFPKINTNEVMLLIGNDVGKAFWMLDHRRGREDEPFAVRYPLGWVLFGLTGVDSNSSRMNLNVNFQQVDTLQQQLEMIWKTDFADSISDPTTQMSREDKQALDIMQSTVTKCDGKYQLALPFREKPVDLQNNRSVAESRLRNLKKRLQKDEQLLQGYTTTMHDYVSKGHAKKIKPTINGHGSDDAHTTQAVWYLPHHPVMNPNKPGKFRVVFDCAAKFQGKSLNDTLLQGPDFLNNLVGVLIRFRQEPVAMVADVEAMFHQVKVTDEDCNFLRFLWWTDGDLGKPPDEYCMTVHLFGATSSPSCTSFCLKKTAEENKDVYSPEVTRTVERNFYVDDCLKSVPTIQNGIALSKALCGLLCKGGFRLTKWVSNKREVLFSIPEAERAPSVKNIEFDEDLPFERALGLQWNVESDTFTFKVQIKERPLTRRGILSMTSSLYDPLGLVAPVVLLPKIILQNLCRSHKEWDELIDEKSAQSWMEWQQALPQLCDISVPRCFKPDVLNEITKRDYVELHHFADASTLAYGAVSYLKIYDNDNSRVSLIMGKSRLAPIKEITIPRLELSAAVVAVRLHQLIIRELELKVDKYFLWTDSMSTLQYIRNRNKRFKTFVANRLAIIHDVTEPTDWYYVPTECNPADLASRGIRPDEKDKLEYWHNGPDFLHGNTYPTQPNYGLRNQVLCDEDLEVKSIFSTTSGYDVMGCLIQRHSSWRKLCVSLVWILRFKVYCCDKYLWKQKIVSCGHITLNEVKQAEDEIIKHVQQQTYKDEIKCLKAHSYVSKSSSIAKLCPMLAEGHIKVGGRLQNAAIDENMKHPVILPSKHLISTLIIRHFHEANGHVGVQHVLSLLRSRYWITQGVSAVKRVIGNCFGCKRRKQKACVQIMAPLPPERLEPDKPPFSYVGVDYFGPLMVKVRRSHDKRYGCLFTCLTTRAVHIEIAHSLDTDSFLGALSRFIGRRGKPLKIFSDNGTNLTCGEKELRHSLRHLNQKKIYDYIIQKEIDWNFNPPTASHMGGIWERMIRSTRQILKALVKDQLMSDETLLTFVIEAEKILNDRPIITVSDDVNDQDPLSPSQLLLLKSNTSLPPGLFSKDDTYCRRRWRQAQYLANVFWKRWLKEYIPLLQSRNKWLKPKENLRIGDIVLVCDENAPRGLWPLGRVIDVYKGRDGYVRSVNLRLGHTTKVRPIAKLCLLEQVNFIM